MVFRFWKLLPPIQIAINRIYCPSGPDRNLLRPDIIDLDMKEFLKVDLRIARQHSGLRGQDVATLLGVSRSRLSKLENGYARPRVKELIGLSLIYGQSFGELFQLCASRLTDKLEERIATLAENCPESPSNQARQATLSNLADRLSGLNSGYDA